MEKCTPSSVTTIRFLFIPVSIHEHMVMITHRAPALYNGLLRSAMTLRYTNCNNILRETTLKMVEIR